MRKSINSNNTENFLYENPAIYQKVFKSSGSICKSLIDKYMNNTPESILDIGCGTGRDLNELSKNYPICFGVDLNPDLIAFAKKTYPNINFRQGDMRNFRLSHVFDVVIAMGCSLNYALTNDDITNTISTYAAHTNNKTLLIIQILNSTQYFCKMPNPVTIEIEYEGHTARCNDTFSVMPLQQLIERKRVWEFENRNVKRVEHEKFRIIFPLELSHYLERHGFKIMESIYDDKDTLGAFIVAKFDAYGSDGI